PAGRVDRPAVPPDDLQRRLVGFGAVVAEEHPATAAQQADEPLRQRDARLVHEQVAGVDQHADLAADRLDQGRMAVAEGRDRDAGDAVEVADAVDVPDPGALTAGDGHRRGAVVGHHHRVPALPQGVGGGHAAPPARSIAGGSGSTMVPTPESVNTSSSTACGTRPSSTWACGTPPRTARRHASIFGTIPADSSGSSAARSAATISLTSSPAAPSDDQDE